MAEKQFVIFQLHTEEYGIDIKHVQEIVHMQDITRLPQTTGLLEGVIYLRGKVIPVIDLKKRYYGLEIKAGNNNRIIIVDIGNQAVGVIVDDVWEVLRISEDAIEAPPLIIKSSGHAGLAGIGKVENRLILLLDLTTAFTMEERSILEQKLEQN